MNKSLHNLLLYTARRIRGLPNPTTPLRHAGCNQANIVEFPALEFMLGQKSFSRKCRVRKKNVMMQTFFPPINSMSGIFTVRR
jgi:hypothetical protein